MNGSREYQTIAAALREIQQDQKERQQLIDTLRQRYNALARELGVREV